MSGGSFAAPSGLSPSEVDVPGLLDVLLVHLERVLNLPDPLLGCSPQSGSVNRALVQRVRQHVSSVDPHQAFDLACLQPLLELQGVDQHDGVRGRLHFFGCQSPEDGICIDGHI